jgi:hypothetical protein
MIPTKQTIDGETVYICKLCEYIHEATELNAARACCEKSVTPDTVHPPRVTPPRGKVEPYPEQIFGAKYSRVY